MYGRFSIPRGSFRRSFGLLLGGFLGLGRSRFCGGGEILLPFLLPLAAPLDAALELCGRLNLLAVFPPDHHGVAVDGDDRELPLFVFVGLVDGKLKFTVRVHTAFPSPG
jgi:hypothetical protein